MLNPNLSVLITTKCTLNCKYCSSGIPYYKKRKNIPSAEIIKSVNSALNLYTGGVPHLDFLGGEPLLHPELSEIISGMLPFQKKFSEIRILTNSTLLPNERLIQTVKEAEAQDVRVLFILGNYGKLSVQYERLAAMLDEQKISYRTDLYSGEHQYFSGWVSYGQDALPVENIEQVYSDCGFCRSGVLELFDGKVYPCVRLLALHATGRIFLPKDEYIDLSDEANYNREKFISYKTRSASYSGCKMCSGLGKSSKRYPAAEQL